MKYAFQWEDAVAVVSMSDPQFVERVGAFLDIVPVATSAAGAVDVDVDDLSAGGFDVFFEGRCCHCENSEDCFLAVTTYVSASFLRKTCHLVLHSGAVSIDDQAVLFVGQPYAGKSLFALTAWLEGVPVIGDDWIAIDCENKTVIPFPKTLKPRLSIDSLSTDAQQKIAEAGFVEGRMHDVHRLVVSRQATGMLRYGERKPISRMVLLERTEGTLSVSPLPSQDALEILLSQVVPTKSGSVLAVLQVLEPLVNRAACHRLSIGENETRQAVLRILEPN